MEGFTSDPAKAGVERLTVSRLRPEFGMAPQYRLTAANISQDMAVSELLDAHGVLFCKGWTRNVSLQIVLLLGWLNPSFFQAGPTIMLIR